jgi:hypothetical protein
LLANTSVKPSRDELLSKKNHLYVVFKSSLDIAKVMQMPTRRDDQAKDSQNVGTKNEKPNYSNLWQKKGDECNPERKNATFELQSKTTHLQQLQPTTTSQRFRRKTYGHREIS